MLAVFVLKLGFLQLFIIILYHFSSIFLAILLLTTAKRVG